MSAQTSVARTLAALRNLFLEEVPFEEPLEHGADNRVPPQERSACPEPQLIIAAAVGGGEEALAAGAALGVAMARLRPDSAVLLLDGVGTRRRGPTLLAGPAARRLERELGDGAAARGHLCFAPLAADGPAAPSGLAGPTAPSGLAGPTAPSLPAPAVDHVIACLQADRWREALEVDPPPAGALLSAHSARDRSLTALAVARARSVGVPIRVLPPLGRIGARRALAGVDPAGRLAPRIRRAALALGSERGQATVMLGGIMAAVAVMALAAAAVSGAVTGKGRMQRAADLAAVSAGRTMREDFDRLFSPARLPDGKLNPAHLERADYLARARAAARRAARLNGAAERRVRITFPDGESMAPVRVKVTLHGFARMPKGDPEPVRVWAEARISAGTAGAAPATASGGGYSGPLEQRNGEAMRPDVARAFDRMSRAARRAGVGLIVNSGFRSDAEQARLFAQNPDPRWVAPPGRSLHRCATELDLGPSAAHGWLARNAERFGFRQRYSWEPWHYGFVAGPAPCSADASQAARRDGDGRASGLPGLPGFVPAGYRDVLADAASRHGVSPSLLASQLMVESNFNPHAVSPAGARGIAQFMPGTARAYGVDDPLDPAEAIEGQARLMADLLKRFGSPALALAAYNAGPGAVERFGGVPPYAETRAYVARVLALAGGGGSIAAGSTVEVELVD